MPPATTQASNSNRRSTGPIRQRENRLHNQQSAPARRRKSRSPDGRGGDDAATSAPSDSYARRKKRPMTLAGTSGPSSSNVASLGAARLMAADDASSDRGRGKTSKSRTRPAVLRVDEDETDVNIVTNILGDPGRPQAPAQSARTKRKERSRSRDAQRHARKTATPEPMEDEEEPVYTGPLAQAEYVRMRQEVELLRKVCSASFLLLYRSLMVLRSK